MTVWLTLLLLWAAGLAQAQAQPQPQPQWQSQKLAAGSTHSSAPINVQALGESRLTLQFDVPVTVTRITLAEPGGHRRDLALGSAVLVVPAAQRQDKRRGDQHVLLVPVLNPVPGAWRLDIEHLPARGGEALQLLHSQFPRFDLRLGLVGGEQRIGAGSERLIELRASDQGRAATGLLPQGSVLHLDSGTRVPLRFWSERPASYDLPVQAEPGQYFAVFAPELPGRYSAAVQQDFTGSDGKATPVQRELPISVAPQTVLRTLRVETTLGPAGCVTGLNFSVDWPAQAPGRYALTVVLQGGTQTRRMGGGADASAPGPLRLQAALTARDALALGEPLQALRVDVLHASATGFELLQRRRLLPLSEPLQAAALCR
jgi:hypothetical protein